MPVDPVLKYLNEVETAFRKLSSGYIERYEEEYLTPQRVNFRIRVRFQKGCMLEWNEAIIGEEGHVDHLAYRYHFQDRGINLSLGMIIPLISRVLGLFQITNTCRTM